ncbi:putative aaa atpase [Anaeramoeba ignava]|uniref:Aaa atpase n=1 Tax=Anaeramoeba ignava TaxID=1746090 RepID=A0A9Q0LRH3_ANAIG|nr:putative aaa atpase [Anaeramoeba ignava]
MTSKPELNNIKKQEEQMQQTKKVENINDNSKRGVKGFLYSLFDYDRYILLREGINNACQSLFDKNLQRSSAQILVRNTKAYLISHIRDVQLNKNFIQQNTHYELQSGMLIHILGSHKHKFLYLSAQDSLNMIFSPKEMKEKIEKNKKETKEKFENERNLKGDLKKKYHEKFQKLFIPIQNNNSQPKIKNIIKKEIYEQMKLMCSFPLQDDELVKKTRSKFRENILFVSKKGTEDIQYQLCKHIAKENQAGFLKVDFSTFFPVIKESKTKQNNDNTNTSGNLFDSENSKNKENSNDFDVSDDLDILDDIEEDSDDFEQSKYDEDPNQDNEFEPGQLIKFVGTTLSLDTVLLLNGTQLATPKLGPLFGSVGFVQITFPNSNYVGVQFNNKLSSRNGHTLGGICEQGVGAFVRKKDLEKATGFVNKKIQMLLFLDTLFEFVQDQKNQPLLIYIRDPDLILFDFPEIYHFMQFKMKIVVNVKAIFIFAVSTDKWDYFVEVPNIQSSNIVSFIMPRMLETTKITNSDISETSRIPKYLDMVRRKFHKLVANWMDFQVVNSMRKIFTMIILLPPPTHFTSLIEWNNKVSRCLERKNAIHNRKLLNSLISECNVELDFHLKFANFEKKLNRNQIIRIIRNAISQNLLRNTFEKPNNEKVLLSKQDIQQGYQLYTLSKKNHAKKAVENEEDLDEFEKKWIPHIIKPDMTGVSFKDVAGLENEISALQEIVILPLKRPDLFQRGNLAKPLQGVLLVGAPGTGKTLVAKALATESQAHFINVSINNISSKHFGEAEKNVRALFTLAYKLSPSVIFIDDVDCFLNQRSSDHQESEGYKIKNSFLEFWDGMKSSEYERVIVVAATNRPQDLDDAILRRFSRQIFLDIPNKNEREKIIRLILKDEELEENFDFNRLAEETPGFTGSDLRNLSVLAAHQPIREILSKKLSKLSDISFRPLTLYDFQESIPLIVNFMNENQDSESYTELLKWRKKPQNLQEPYDQMFN